MKKKTLWIINQFAGTPSDGWGERHYYLTKYMDKDLWNIIVITSSNNHMFKSGLQKRGIEVVSPSVEYFRFKLPNYNPRNATRFIAMLSFALLCYTLPWRLRNRPKPDYILLSSMSLFPTISLTFLKRYYDSKLIYEIRDLWPLTPILLMNYSSYNPMIIWMKYLEIRAVRVAETIFAVMPKADQYLLTIDSNIRKRFVHLPNGYDPDLIARNESVRRSRQIKNSAELVVCYTGTMGYANALGPLVDLLASDESLAKYFKFVFVGSGYLASTYIDQIGHLGHVTFTGKVEKEKVLDYLIASDIAFIGWHNSELYKYGVSANKYFDYMASGIPILSAQEGIVDPVSDSGCGIITPNEMSGIKRALMEFKNMKREEREAMGRIGLEYLKQNHLYDNLSVVFSESITR